MCEADKHMKSCSVLSVIRERQIKTAKRVAQLEKGLPCKPGDLSSAPSTHSNTLGIVVIPELGRSTKESLVPTSQLA